MADFGSTVISGLTGGFSQGFNAAMARRKHRQQVEQYRDRRDLEWAERGYNRNEAGELVRTPGGQADLQQQQRETLLYNLQQQETMQRQMFKMQGQEAQKYTDNTIDQFFDSGNAEDLNHLYNNPMLKPLLQASGVQSFSNIDYKNDVPLLQERGIPETAYDTPEKQKKLGKFNVKIFNGTKHAIVDMNETLAATGYYNRAYRSKLDALQMDYSDLVKMFAGKLPGELDYAELELSREQFEEQKRATGEREKLAREQMASDAAARRAAARQRASQKEIPYGWSSIPELTGYNSLEEYDRQDFVDRKIANPLALTKYKERLKKTNLTTKQEETIQRSNTILNTARDIMNLPKSSIGPVDDAFARLFKSFGYPESKERIAFNQLTVPIMRMMAGASLTSSERKEYRKMLGDLSENKKNIFRKLSSLIKQNLLELETIKRRMPIEFMDTYGSEYQQVGRIFSDLQYLQGDISENRLYQEYAKYGAKPPKDMGTGTNIPNTQDNSNLNQLYKAMNNDLQSIDFGIGIK